MRSTRSSYLRVVRVAGLALDREDEEEREKEIPEGDIMENREETLRARRDGTSDLTGEGGCGCI